MNQLPVELRDVQPINGNIILKDIPRKKKTSGGIYLPDTDVPELNCLGIVIFSSDGKSKKGKTIPTELKPGDKVMYSFLAGAKGYTIKADDGTFYRVIEEKEVVAKIEE